MAPTLRCHPSYLGVWVTSGISSEINNKVQKDSKIEIIYTFVCNVCWPIYVDFRGKHSMQQLLWETSELGRDDLD